jgi:hypothetical protein
MHDRVKITAKKPEAKKSKPVHAPKGEFNSPISSPIDQIFFLQRTIGNHAVQRLFTTGIFQSKLRIGQPNDTYEQEADRVAEQVMSMPEPRLQRQAEEEEEEEEELQTKPVAGEITPLVQRQPIEEEEEEIQTKPLASRITPLLQRQPIEEEEEVTLQTKETSKQSPAVSANLENNIQSLKTGGTPLPAPIRAFFEPRFGHDFSKVKLHTNTQAAELARTVNAKAFTVGRNVIFGSGQYIPETAEGKKLMAHELTHVVQQSKCRFSSSHHLQRYTHPFTAVALEARRRTEHCSVPARQHGASKVVRFAIFDFRRRAVRSDLNVNEQFRKLEGPDDIFRRLSRHSRRAVRGRFNDCYRLFQSSPLPRDLRLKVEQNHLVGTEIISKNHITYTPNTILVCIFSRRSRQTSFNSRCKNF